MIGLWQRIEVKKMVKHMHRCFVCLVILLVLFSQLFALSAAADRDIPLLRVLLRRLDIGSQIDLLTDGQYMLEGANGSKLLLFRNTEFTVELRGSDLILFLQDASLSLGSSAKLIRMNDGGTSPSLKIGKAAGIYPGDLSLTVENERIMAVLSLSVEDYLLGVVPNEMSDGFPLEALKAQAVCARTYAVKKLGSSGNWDVVDTTNDQVFRGISSSDVNSARAVADTAGLVLTKNGRIVEGYYSASNGGQTEIPSNVWGGNNYTDCYVIKDDPWDAANPDSLTRTADIPHDGTSLYRRMTALLRNAVFDSSVWKNSGFQSLDNNFRVDRIVSMELKSPRFASPSRVMTKIEIVLSVSGRKVSGGTLGGFESAGLVSVTLPVSDVLDALGLQLSSSDNEIVTVEETETFFRLTASRYGHGVGLSQRGAQWMAASGHQSYTEILDFYFPGAELSLFSENGVELSTPSPLLLPAQEQPVPSVTPGPTLMPVTQESLPEGAWMASVEGISDGSSLNLRSDPSPIAPVLMRLYKHQRLIVLDELDVPGWAHVRTDDIEGYVMSSYLEKADIKED